MQLGTGIDRRAEGGGALGDPQQDAGVGDLERFRRETTSSTYDAAIAEDRAPTQKYGIIGVPAFVINGEPIIGTHEAEVYTGVIDGRLAGS